MNYLLLLISYLQFHTIITRQYNRVAYNNNHYVVAYVPPIKERNLMFTKFSIHSSNSPPTNITGKVIQENMEIEDISIGLWDNGDLVIAWVIKVSRIAYAQVYKADGTPYGNKIIIGKHISRTSIATLPKKRFVIARQILVDTENYRLDIFYSIYDFEGDTILSQNRSNLYRPWHQILGSAVSDPYGNFMIVWETQQQENQGSEIYANIYNSSGHSQRDPFRVNTNPKSDSIRPMAIATLKQNSFFITWRDNSQGHHIKMKGYDSQGKVILDDLQVTDSVLGTYDADAPYDSFISIGPSDEIIILWNYWDQNKKSLNYRIIQEGDKISPIQKLRITDFIYPSFAMIINENIYFGIQYVNTFELQNQSNEVFYTFLNDYQPLEALKQEHKRKDSKENSIIQIIACSILAGLLTMTIVYFKFIRKSKRINKILQKVQRLKTYKKKKRKRSDLVKKEGKKECDVSLYAHSFGEIECSPTTKHEKSFPSNYLEYARKEQQQQSQKIIIQVPESANVDKDALSQQLVYLNKKFGQQKREDDILDRLNFEIQSQEQESDSSDVNNREVNESIGENKSM